jgi:pyruvate dehydrogenase E2 component (dihydrolipoamide acetyltransferase)
MNNPYRVEALSPLRSVIAARMSEATRTIPHFRLVVDVGVDALLALKNALNRQRPEARVSLNDLFIKASAGALGDVPALNIQWADKVIHAYENADISMITAVQGGLATPIVRNANLKTIWEISNEAKTLSARAAKQELKMDEILGGTFSISNLGMYGVDQFDAIINAPQCAILAVGAVKPRCATSGEGDFGSVNAVRLTLSVDHRVIDGVTAAKFMAALRERLAKPDHMNA